MPRFNDSATDTLEYVAEHGVKFTWRDFKIVQTDESAYYVWNPTSKTYMWSGTPEFSYRLDIDKNVRDIVFVNDGTLPDIFVMDDGVHGPVDYNANMASQNFSLSIYCDVHHFIYFNNTDGTLTINNVDYKEEKNIDVYFITVTNEDAIVSPLLTNMNNRIYINAYDGVYFSIMFQSNDINKQLYRGLIYVNINSIYQIHTLVGECLELGQL